MSNFKLQNSNYKPACNALQSMAGRSIFNDLMFKTLGHWNLIKNSCLALRVRATSESKTGRQVKFKIKNLLLISKSKGSAMVAVLVIMAVALLVITAIMQNSLIDTDMSYNLKKSDEAYNNAISALEESELRLLRDPAFSGVTLNFSDGSAIINVNKLSETQRQISVISRVKNSYICQITASATYNASGVLLIDSISEITN